MDKLSTRGNKEDQALGHDKTHYSVFEKQTEMQDQQMLEEKD